MHPFASRIVKSALWAAYGDALGFITELANPTLVKTRVGSPFVCKTVPWTRRVGGKFGADCKLPAGCYSDDTQLRLATCRAIRSNGSFDIEAFAKMELPVWTCYALGAGRGSKAAAASLAREGVTWFSNFYQAQGASFIEGGGNGGAMRIQPHIWSMRSNSGQMSLIEAITKNTICTHGHARGILGSVFHGLCLRHVILNDSIPTYNDCKDFVERLPLVATVIENDPDLRLFWLPVWEQKTGTRFRDACMKVQSELHHDISILASIPNGNPNKYYNDAVEQLGAMDASQRGSATKTALLAIALSNAFGVDDLENGLIAAANLLGSDTDSIATMAGALLGFLAEHEPANDILDRQYIIQMAKRMAKIALTESVDHIRYPDLMKWSPPKTQQDSVVSGETGLEVLLLGKVIMEGDSFSASRSDSGFWQWLSVESGQTVLAKRKKHPNPIKGIQSLMMKSVSPQKPNRATQEDTQLEFAVGDPQKVSLDDLTHEAIHSGFDPLVIGKHVVSLADMSDGIEKAIAYAAIIAKARIARKKRGN